MLEKIFEINPEVYKYSHSACSQPSFLFYGDSVIKSWEDTQQENPESPVLFSDSIFRIWLTVWKINLCRK